MARHFDEKNRRRINSQLSAADGLQSAARVGSALAAGGLGAEDVVSQVAQLLQKGRSGYLKRLKLTPLADHLDMVSSSRPHVMALGVATLPLEQAPVLSRFTSVARHEIVFMVLDLHWEPTRVYSMVPGRSVYEHRFAAVMFEFNDDSAVAGSYTDLTFQEKRYGVPYFRSGPERTSAGDVECKKFLKSKGIKPLSDFFHSNDTRSFDDVLGFVHRWSVDNHEYDIDAINCKAFARTMYDSYVSGQYRFHSDAGRDTWHKAAAHFIQGDLRSKASSRPPCAAQIRDSGFRSAAHIGKSTAQHGLGSHGFDPDFGSLGPESLEDRYTGHGRRSNDFDLESEGEEGLEEEDYHVDYDSGSEDDCRTGHPKRILCGQGHPLVHNPKRAHMCDVCEKSGTTFRCGSGCDYDTCDRCGEEY